MNILQIKVILFVSTGLGDDLFYGGGVVVASMYPASRIVVKPINCKLPVFWKYSIVENIVI